MCESPSGGETEGGRGWREAAMGLKIADLLRAGNTGGYRQFWMGKGWTSSELGEESVNSLFPI